MKQPLYKQDNTIVVVIIVVDIGQEPIELPVSQ